MRRKDLRGEKAWRGAEESMRERIWERVAGEKMVGSWRLVMRRVLEGGEGVMRGGREERSSVRGEVVAVEVGLVSAEVGGETVVFGIVMECQ